MRHCGGKSTSPLSACSSPRSRPNRLDLPEPFAPIRPTRSPGLIDASAPSSSGLTPRTSVRLEKRIKASLAKSPRFYSAGRRLALRTVPALRRVSFGAAPLVLFEEALAQADRL